MSLFFPKIKEVTTGSPNIRILTKTSFNDRVEVYHVLGQLQHEQNLEINNISFLESLQGFFSKK